MTEYNDQITFKLSDERLEWIDDQVELRDSNRSEIIRRSLGVAEKATLDYSGDGEASRERVEELEQEAQSLRYKLDRREQEIERLEKEIDEKVSFDDIIEELTLLIQVLDDNLEDWKDRLRDHQDELKDFDGRIDELEETVETETSAVRSGVGERIEALQTVLENAQETIVNERDQRDVYWDNRLEELTDRLDAIEDDRLDAIEDELETINEELESEDGGLF
jgi:chromosome segregation ATPase